MAESWLLCFSSSVVCSSRSNIQIAGTPVCSLQGQPPHRLFLSSVKSNQEVQIRMKASTSTQGEQMSIFQDIPCVACGVSNGSLAVLCWGGSGSFVSILRLEGEKGRSSFLPLSKVSTLFAELR